LEKLLEWHSAGPAVVQPFLAAQAEHGAAFFKTLKESVVANQSKVFETSSELCARFADFEAQVKHQNQAEMQSELRQLRDRALEVVHRSSDALGEVVDPESMKSQNHVLVARYGKDAVAEMNDEKKKAAYEELTAERISEHEVASYSSAKELLQGSTEAAHFVDEILTAGNQVESLERQANSAEQRKEEAATALEALKKSLINQKQKCASCEAQKRAGLSVGDGKRAAVKKALLDLQQASDEFGSWYVENEALRLQIQRLKASISSTENEIDFAEEACQEASWECDKWRDYAHDAARTLRTQQTSATQVAVEHAADAIVAASLNVRVGIELSEKVLRDKDAEIASLESDKGAIAEEVERLKSQLKQPCKDVRVNRSHLAQMKDKLARLDTQIASCRSKRSEVDRMLDEAHRSYASIVALNAYGLSLQEQLVCQSAKRLADEAYGHLQCFSNSQPDAEQSPPVPNQGVIPSLPSDLKSMFQELLEEQKRFILLQIKADLAVRGRAGNDQGWSAGSLAGSDAGESAFNIIQDAVAADHSSNTPDAVGARGSGKGLADDPEAQVPRTEV